VFEKNKEKVIKDMEQKLQIEGSTKNVVGSLLQGYLEKTEDIENKQIKLNKEKKKKHEIGRA